MEGMSEAVPLETIHQGSTFKQRVVKIPSIHLQETRTVEGTVIEGKGNRESSAQWQRLGNERFAHRSRHLCTQTHTPTPFLIPTPDDPPDQPHFFATQQQDWDLWKKHKDLVFQGKGLHPADPMWERVYALAEDIWTFRRVIQKPGGNDFSRECPWSSPTAALLYGSWCAGAGPLTTALCATLGVPARMVQVFDHMMTEVRVDGMWCLVDSAVKIHKAGGNMMLHASLADVLLEPTNPAWEFVQEQQETFWEKTMFMYSSQTGRFHEEAGITYMTPQNALALYPGWTDPRFKSHRPDTYELAWGYPGAGHPQLILKQGQAFQRRFWLGSLKETKTITARLFGEAGGKKRYAPHNVPEDGGDWFIAVNGKRYTIREQGGWQFAKQDGSLTDWLQDIAWGHDFELPLGDLKECDWNEVAVGCPGAGAEFLRFAGYNDWILPEEPCFISQVES